MKSLEQEQIDFFETLSLKIDWRGTIYGKEESNKETACGTSEGAREASEEKKVAPCVRCNFDYEFIQDYDKDGKEIVFCGNCGTEVLKNVN